MNQHSSMDLSVSNTAPDAVSRRAYEIWEREGCPDGCDMRHWLQAEEELRAKRNGVSRAQPAAAAVPARDSDVTPLQGTRAAAAAKSGAKRGGSATPFGTEKNGGQTGRRKAATPAL